MLCYVMLHVVLIIAVSIFLSGQDMIATLAHPKVVPGDARSVAQLDGAVSGPIESTAGVLSHDF